MAARPVAGGVRVVRAHKRALRARSHGRALTATGLSPCEPWPERSGGPRRGWRSEHVWEDGTSRRKSKYHRWEQVSLSRILPGCSPFSSTSESIPSGSKAKKQADARGAGPL